MYGKEKKEQIQPTQYVILQSKTGKEQPPLPRYYYLTTTPENGKSNGMDLNVTAGVFMVLMIAIVTAILLCCCKTYIVCKKRRRRREFLRRNAETEGGGIHRHLPTEIRYDDSPPSYAEIILNREGEPQPELAISSTSYSETDQSTDDPKHLEDTIEVYWSIDDVTIPPPTYSCAINNNCSRASSGGCRNSRVPNSRLGRINHVVTGVLVRTIQTVSELVFRSSTTERNRLATNNNVSNRSNNRNTTATTTETRDDSTETISIPTEISTSTISTDTITVETEDLQTPSVTSTHSTSTITTTTKTTEEVEPREEKTSQNISSFSATNGAFEHDPSDDMSRDTTEESRDQIASTSTVT